MTNVAEYTFVLIFCSTFSSRKKWKRRCKYVVFAVMRIVFRSKGLFCGDTNQGGGMLLGRFFLRQNDKIIRMISLDVAFCGTENWAFGI